MSNHEAQATAPLKQSSLKFGFSPHIYCWVVLFAATQSQTSIAFISQGIPALAPVFARDLALSKAEVGLVSTAMYIGVVLTVALAGRAVDVLGERKVLVYGGVLCGLSTILASQASSYFFLLVFLVIAGLWSSTATPAGTKAIVGWFPVTLRGFAMGVRQTGLPLGGFFAALVLPALALQWSWREALLVAGAVAIIGAGLCQVLYREPPGFRQQGGSGRGPGLSGSVRQVLRHRSFWLASLASLTFVAAQYMMTVYIQLDFHERLDFSIASASVFLAIGQLAGVAGRIVWGAISDRIFGGRRKPVMILIGLVIAPMSFLVSFFDMGFPLPLIYVIVWFLGFSAIGWNGIYVVLISELVDADHSGLAVGLGLTTVGMGIIAFPPLFGLLIDYTRSYALGWQIVASAVLFGVLALLLAREQPRKVSAGETIESNPGRSES